MTTPPPDYDDILRNSYHSGIAQTTRQAHAQLVIYNELTQELQRLFIVHLNHVSACLRQHQILIDEISKLNTYLSKRSLPKTWRFILICRHYWKQLKKYGAQLQKYGAQLGHFLYKQMLKLACV